MDFRGRQLLNKSVLHRDRSWRPAGFGLDLAGQLQRLMRLWPLLLACAGLDRAVAQSNGPARESNSPGGPQPEAQGVVLLARAQPKPNPGASSASTETPNPTYLRDVLPIIMRRCSRCHNVQARFVYNWLDYRTAYADRFEIARRVWDSWKGTYFKEPMPIANSPEALAITPQERAEIRSWALEGAPRGRPPPPRVNQTRVEKIDMGRRLFSSICAACHQPTGRGIPNVFPPLASSDFLNADKNRAIKTVLNGRQGEIVVNGQRFNNSMPQFPLSDQDIADVLTYVYNSFGNSGVEVSSEEVARLRAEPPDVEQSETPPSKSAPQPKSQFE
jgi:mono/diheme cytochrome c family protein